MTFFITGVGTGIGKATALYALSQGHFVIGTLRNSNQADDLIRESKNLEGKLHLIYADLSHPNFLDDIVQDLTDLQIENINVLINIAGVLQPTTLDDFSFSAMEKVMRVNFFAPAMLIAVLKSFLAKGTNANIINITSMSGFQGSVRFPGLSIYGASKAALGSLSESLAIELERHHIKINALAIGAVSTDMLKEAFPEFHAPIEPQDMAEFIYSFATHGYRFFNGKTIPVAVTNP